MIRFEQVTKWLGGRAVLDGIDLEIEKGETFFIVGTSGAGKSVTLKHMIRLLTPDSGRVWIGEDCVSEARGRFLGAIRGRFGVLFQSAALLAWINAGDNVGLPLRQHTNQSDAEIALSGGMRKRVGLARAVITHPEIILYDEPTSGLDPVTARAIDALIDSLRQRLGVTSVVVRAGERDAHRHAGWRTDCGRRHADGVRALDERQGAAVSRSAIHHQTRQLGKGGGDMKKNSRQDTTIEVIVGFFFAMMIVALFFGTAVLSRQRWFGGNYKLEVVFESVMGLRKGDNVFVRGVDVGKVDRLQIKGGGAHVYISLEQPVEVHAGYKVEVLPSSVLGGRYLALDLGTAAQPEVPAGTVLRGLTPVDLIDEATSAIADLRKTMEEGKMLENLAATMADLRKITGKLAAGEGTLGKLLMEEQVYSDIKATTARLKEISERLAAGEGTLGKLLAKDDQLYKDMAATVASIKNIAAKIEKGEGTLGKLAQDDTLYQDFKKTLSEGRAAIDDFREYAPLATFSSLFLGAF
ncbi:MAG: ATP-binding cassette domain-containing protein [Kiritimatiellaeota bacterium]|nr:ATP-binding cassette domain-containing protein [Kiritimatiellota bacterium]